MSETDPDEEVSDLEQGWGCKQGCAVITVLLVVVVVFMPVRLMTYVTIYNLGYKRWALKRLARAVEPAQAAVPFITVALGEDEASLRYYGAAQLRYLGAKSAEAVPALIHILDDNDEGVRLVGVQALEAVGPAARAALPKLGEMVKDQSLQRNTRTSAYRAMRTLLGGSKDIPRDVKDALLKARKG